MTENEKLMLAVGTNDMERYGRSPGADALYDARVVQASDRADLEAMRLGRRLADLKDTKMSVVIGLPPNIDAIDEVFHGVKARAARDGIYFCYANTIYNPCGRGIEMQIVAHECTHSLQQIAYGVEKWWDDYLKNPNFRLGQELEAHRVEYEKFVKDHPGRAYRRRYARLVAERLSGPLYNRMISKKEALWLIGFMDTAIKGDTNGI
jgi:hypothetical protein